ncbi:uncharacterized protein MONOS_17264 [Monocercomonoides exilis]|uniref:uncharacterized protein n=1 Tax=Monocercomonoides exilis TaxID=2049356 RepID=UPI0035594950|nr:hypothetical protein MONOS_17264 [Monocercomonoides exilis]
MMVKALLVELHAKWEQNVGKPVVEGIMRPDGKMSITFTEERQIQRGQRETMDEFVAIGEVVPRERDDWGV